MYSQVTKQIQQGIHKGSWEAAQCRQLPHARKKKNTPLIFASWFVYRLLHKNDRIRCSHFVLFKDSRQWSYRPKAPLVLFQLYSSCGEDTSSYSNLYCRNDSIISINNPILIQTTMDTSVHVFCHLLEKSVSILKVRSNILERDLCSISYIKSASICSSCFCHFSGVGVV